ncbi:MAG TPA: hypothetical protein ENJ26_04490 [Rhodobacteraceae bacterium]|nr:hypothetical protein [Paracoccaceae bacterium]
MRYDLLTVALKRAIRAMTDPKVIGILLLSLALMLLLTGPFVGVFLALVWIIELLTPEKLNLPWLGEVSFLGVFTKGLVSRTSWVFWTYIMAPVAVSIVGFFLDRIVAAVEARDYPALPAIRSRTFSESLIYSLRFLALMATVSLAALIASFFAGILAPVIFVLANGYLISKEYFDTVGLRRLPETEVSALEGANQTTLWLLGIGLALGLTVPFLNLLIPIFGVAAYTHVFHGLIGNRPVSELQ